MLEQHSPHLVCRQDVYLKNPVDWELVRGKVRNLNWNEIIRFSCPVLSLNEALLRVIRDGVFKRMIVVKTEISLGLTTSVYWLTVRSRDHI